MSQSAVIHARIDPGTKETTEQILDSLGLTPTEAIRLFYRQSAMRGEFPLELRVPSSRTAETLEKADRGEEIEDFSSADDLYASRDSWGSSRPHNSKRTRNSGREEATSRS
jgi:DNA-damage-inducible protein J